MWECEAFWPKRKSIQGRQEPTWHLATGSGIYTHLYQSIYIVKNIHFLVTDRYKLASWGEKVYVGGGVFDNLIEIHWRAAKSGSE